MLDSLHEFSGPAQPLDREGPEAMQAFVGRHRAFFVLVAVMLGQLLLLSIQITRSQNVRLIQVWAVAVFEPFERSLHWVSSSARGTWRSYAGLWHAQEENKELRQELLSEQTRLQQLSEQAAEAQSLRALLDLKKSAPFETIAAEVIAASPGERSNAIFIDKGANVGLRSDWAVITPGGVVGKIIAVFPHTSQVLLITDPSSGVGCMLEQSRVQGVLKGTGQSLPDLHYILNEHPVAVGEKVLTSGLDQIYPRGLVVGTVITTHPGSIYRTITVKPAAPLDHLESVLVVRNPSTGPPGEEKTAARP